MEAAPSDTPSPARRLDRAWLGLLVVLLGLAMLYSPLLVAGYAWDDEALILAREEAPTLELGGDLLQGELWAGLGEESRTTGYYRPAFLASLAIDEALWPGQPGAAHAHSILWHLAAVLALFVLLGQLVPLRAALIGAALFGMHPIQSEAVAWIAARNDLMVGALGLAGIAALLPERPGPLRLAAGALLLLGAFLSKEAALAALVLLLALDLQRWGRPRGWSRLVAALGAAAVYLVLRLQSGLEAPSLSLPALGELPAVVGLYLGKLIWPWPLSVGQELSALSLPVASVLAAACASVLLIVLALRGRGLARAGLVFALAAFLPVLISIAVQGQLGERYLYLPMAGLALAVAASLPVSLPRTGTAVVLGVLGLASVLAIGTRLPDWRDSEALWRAEVERLPTGYAHAQLANLLHKQGRADEAEPHYRASLEADPPRLDRCPDALRSSLDLPDPGAGLALVDTAYDAGCPRTARSEGGRALLLVAAGRWAEGVQVASEQPEDPSGRAQLITAAEAKRTGRVDELERIAEAYASRQVPRNDFDAMVAALLSGAAAPAPPPVPAGTAEGPAEPSSAAPSDEAGEEQQQPAD